MAESELNFDVSTGLKNVLGRELITDDEVAIFEMVKNSFDAGADKVHLYFDDDQIVVADNGSGMTYEDLLEKWLFVAYSTKRDKNSEDFRNIIASRSHLAGSKGIGRFSTDRLGKKITLQTLPKKGRSKTIHQVTIDWLLFEQDDKQHFDEIPVDYETSKRFTVPTPFRRFVDSLQHGTIIQVEGLRHKWSRSDLQGLKAALAKLINPFGAHVDQFSIFITAPQEKAKDNKAKSRAKAAGEEISTRDIVNGKVGNFIFSDLQEKTTFLVVELDGGHIVSTLTDRGAVVYKIKEPNPYSRLEGSGFRSELYYLNQSAKVTFARRVGLPSVKFGSVFLFRNGFRVFPIGEEQDDWFGYNRRKQQGYSRYLGSRELIGRVDVYGSDDDFQEASSRNQGLIETPAVRELKRCFMEHCLKRLEKYVVPVSWKDPAESKTDDLSRLLTDPGKARVAAAVAGLVDNDEIELISYNKKLIGLLNERSNEFESSLTSLRAIASKLDDARLLKRLDLAEKRFEELQKSEAEARKVADRERSAALKATERARLAEERASAAEQEADTQRRQAHFLAEVVDLDVATILNLHHQVTIYSVDIHQQIENLIQETAGKRSIPRAELLGSIEQVAYLNRKIQAITTFAAKANFQLDSEKIKADLAAFFVDYIENVSSVSASARLRLEVENDHPGFSLKFNPIDVSIIIDNLISNSKRARATNVHFAITQPDKSTLQVVVTDNGRGIAKGADPKQIFDMGYTTTHGSGLGLYHVRHVLGEMGGTIELNDEYDGKGVSFLIKIAKGRAAP